jgi:tRNA modification GTPase
MDTIFALSSGAPPAGIAVMRISGPAAGTALHGLAGGLPPPRQATLKRLHDSSGVLLDDALVLWLPGPGTATGEDLAELHLHGGRAVVAAVEAALGALAGLRRAEPGEFTRRAFANGRIDLAQAEGLADLLEAETEWQRRAALVQAGGALSRRVEDWRERLLGLSAALEASLDFADEDDVAELPGAFRAQLDALSAELASALRAPSAEVLREGLRVAIAGPPNAGKSSLFNSLLETDAAIATPIAGTTRDVLERSVALGGIAFTLVDMAGLREAGADTIEAHGIERARAEVKRADLVLWLGPEGRGPPGAWEVDSKIDLPGPRKSAGAAVSSVSGEGLNELKAGLIVFGQKAVPGPGEAALNKRQRDLLGLADEEIEAARVERDPLLMAERLRAARVSFDRLVGRTTTDDVLDALFGRFCIGK